MRTSDFDYELPRSAIAQPPARRDASKLLALDRLHGTVAHRSVRDLPELLAPGDCVVLNDTKVFRARLRGSVDGHSLELLLVRPIERGADHEERSDWIVLAKPARRCRVGVSVRIGSLSGVVSGVGRDGSVRMCFHRSAGLVIAYANAVGEVPMPPYISTPVDDLDTYQTSYARHVGSVAAPTAGFHLTPKLLDALRTKGVQVVTLTLHVGLGTFQPIRSERLDEHIMHAEWVHLPRETADAINATHGAGACVVAVGTTTLRALEGSLTVPLRSPDMRLQNGYRAVQGVTHAANVRREAHARSQATLQPFSGFVDCFITPGASFTIVDALLTNFHLPRSTLLVLVSAFAAPGERSLRGRDLVLRAYREALNHGYRFYSFGDAMLIR